MSVRIYSGPHSDRNRGPAGWLKVLPWVFVGLTILGQIVWVLVSGNTRVALTGFTVTTFFFATASHAYLNRGTAWATGYLAISLAFGWLIEVLGTITQFPFGDYSYSDALGPALLGVPIVIPMAWSMMAYPCLLAAQRLTSSTLSTVMVAGWLLASWDLFLDPQMVGESYWIWNEIGWELPGISGIPLQNFLGWLLSALVLMFLLDRLPRKVANDAVPNTMLIWIFSSNIFANLVFFGRPAVAVWGAVCMGVVIVPWMWRLWSQPRW